MFRFADVGRVWVPVPLPMGNAEGDGEVVVHLLQDLYSKDELRARERGVFSRTAGTVAARAAQAKSAADIEQLFDEVTATENADTEELVRRTHDWRGVVDEESVPIAFSAERLQAIVKYDWVFKAARQALFEASREGVRKNSLPGPDGSPTPAQA